MNLKVLSMLPSLGGDWVAIYKFAAPSVVADVSDYSPCQRKLLPALICCYV